MPMDTSVVISKLEREWDIDEGFLGLLRNGKFDAAKLERLIATLKQIRSRDGDAIGCRLVSLLWYMPIFMEWQRERVHEAGGDLKKLDRASDRVLGQMERILGVP
ncbi:MAG TPA: hypothetical protein VKD71_04500 [Gemmataceae bacterium]|nr:hypothetical protein [Gemmataceae bacterium]